MNTAELRAACSLRALGATGPRLQSGNCDYKRRPSASQKDGNVIQACDSVDGFYPPVFPEDTVLSSSQKSVFLLPFQVTSRVQKLPRPSPSDVASLPELSYCLPQFPDLLEKGFLGYCLVEMKRNT